MALGTAIKNIQQGTGTESVAGGAVDTVDVTITAVVMAKTVVQVWAVCGFGSVNMASGFGVAPQLTSTTNLRLFIGSGAITGTATVYYTWQVIEYY